MPSILTPSEVVDEICALFGAGNSSRCVLFLDLDGTLVPLIADRSAVRLSPRANTLLGLLAVHPRIETVVVSGRSRSSLESILSGIELSFAAEHGALFVDARAGGLQVVLSSADSDWCEALPVLHELCMLYPNSEIEQKEFGIVWHFRRCVQPPVDLGGIVARLRSCLPADRAKVLPGKSIVEIRRPETDKGAFVKWYLERLNPGERPLALAIGDDLTDEDMFEAVKGCGGIALKIGDGTTVANYRLPSSVVVLDFLQAIIDIQVPALENDQPSH